MTISELITDKLSETETQIGTSIDWTAIKTRAIELGKMQVYGSNVAESTITDTRVKDHIALIACCHLIDAAIDYMMYARRVAESKDNANWTYHDTVKILQDKRRRYAQQIEANREEIKAIIEGVRRADEVIGVSTLKPNRIDSTYKITPSPWLRRPKKGY